MNMLWGSDGGTLTLRLRHGIQDAEGRAFVGFALALALAFWLFWICDWV